MAAPSAAPVLEMEPSLPSKGRHMRGIAESLHEAHEKGEHDMHGPCFACRRTLGMVLESHLFELFVVGLVLMELCMTVFEIGMDNQWFCVGATHLEAKEDSYLCQAAEGPIAERYLEFCEHAGMSILLFFSVELLLKIAVSPHEFFCHNPWHFLDLLVVVISNSVVFIINPHLKAAGKPDNDWPMLVLFCRLWRVVKIARSFDEELVFMQERSAKEAKDQNKQLRQLCKANNVSIPPELQELLGKDDESA